MRVSGRRVLPLFVVAMVLVGAVTAVFQSQAAFAVQITARSLTLQAGVTDGGSKAGGNVNHLFAFTLPGGNTVGSIQFLYCTTASGTCTMPGSLSTASATLGTETGVTGFTINTGTAGAPYLTRSAAAIGSNVPVTYRLDGVVNPAASNTTFYVRISTFAATTPTGGAQDTGTVAASTANQITLTGTMPESLIFCTGAQVLTTGGIPDCATATAGTVNFNQLFSPTDTATATSQMAASTNAVSGYVITVAGPTLTNGAFTIPAMSSTAVGLRGTRQFGMNLKLNTTSTSTPAVGLEVAPTPNGTTLKGQAAAGYSTVDQFKFASGDTVASSTNGGAGASDAQIYTASYIVNVSGGVTAGTYTTTLTYVCTATY